MGLDFKGKSVVITGATSGIGLDLLKALKRDGQCRLCAVARNSEKLKKLKEVLGQDLFTVSCDLRNKEEVDTLFEKLQMQNHEWTGAVDVFIANAGYGYYETIQRPDWRHTESIFALNVFSPIYSLEKMIAWKGKEPFHFVVTGSAIALAPTPGYALYSATKSALDGFSRAYQYEKGSSFTYSIIYPVAIKTPFYRTGEKKMNMPLIRQNRKRNCRNILKGIQAEQKEILPSTILKIFLMFLRIAPLQKIYMLLEQKRLYQWRQERNHRHSEVD